MRTEIPEIKDKEYYIKLILSLNKDNPAREDLKALAFHYFKTEDLMSL